ncbi:MAG: hypothetical protein BWY26_00102 [Elusimicrobia bacterium ADurb.Bin231]|nr:MAG: hypothetical protein BWY26_00102 [Elusimicrobia bacterium ADurb.Bin231]
MKKRDKIYSPAVIPILEAIWEASGYLWSHRIKAAFPLWLPWAKQRFHITEQIRQQLLSISPATIDSRLKNKKCQLKKKIYGTTRPGTLLKHQFQITTDNWDVTIPGFLEIDMVSHSGSSADGNFIQSLNCTDIHTTWTETRAVYDSLAALNAMKDLYRNKLRLFHNFFQPSIKLVKKIRIGSKLKRVYDKPKTPFQRLCQSNHINKDKLAQLKNIAGILDPFALSKTIDFKLTKIYNLASKNKKIYGNVGPVPYSVNNSLPSILGLHS